MNYTFEVDTNPFSDTRANLIDKSQPPNAMLRSIPMNEVVPVAIADQYNPEFLHSNEYTDEQLLAMHTLERLLPAPMLDLQEIHFSEYDEQKEQKRQDEQRMAIYLERNMDQLLGYKDPEQSQEVLALLKGIDRYANTYGLTTEQTKALKDEVFRSDVLGFVRSKIGTPITTNADNLGDVTALRGPPRPPPGPPPGPPPRLPPGPPPRLPDPSGGDASGQPPEQPPAQPPTEPGDEDGNGDTKPIEVGEVEEKVAEPVEDLPHGGVAGASGGDAGSGQVGGNTLRDNTGDQLGTVDVGGIDYNLDKFIKLPKSKYLIPYDPKTSPVSSDEKERYIEGQRIYNAFMNWQLLKKDGFAPGVSYANMAFIFANAALTQYANLIIGNLFETLDEDPVYYYAPVKATPEDIAEVKKNFIDNVQLFHSKQQNNIKQIVKYAREGLRLVTGSQLNKGEAEELFKAVSIAGYYLVNSKNPIFTDIQRTPPVAPERPQPTTVPGRIQGTQPGGQRLGDAAAGEEEESVESSTGQGKSPYKIPKRRIQSSNPFA